MVERIHLSPPHMTGEELALVKEAFESNWVTPLGPHVDAFEAEMCEYLGVKGALALSSGTAAVHLGLVLLGVGPGDPVICSTLTFAASVNPVVYLGAEPIFVDSDEETWNMSPEALERAIRWLHAQGRRPKAVIPVDLYGHSADYRRIREICDLWDIPVLEDAAEALGATYGDRRCGTLGEFGVLSFNGNKIITCGGGGMLVSDRADDLERGRFLSTQAREKAPWYEHHQVGYNYRLSNILAAIGRGQLKVIEDRVACRRRIFDRYVEGLGDLPELSFMPEAPYGRSNRWLTVIQLGEESPVTPLELMKRLEERHVESRPAWKPMHLQPLYRGKAYFPHREGYSVSDRLFQRGLCLPSGSSLREDQQDLVIQIIREAMGER